MKLKRLIYGFLGNSVSLFVFFLLVNLLPSIGLVFTEPYSIMGKIVLIIFPAGLYCVLFSILKNIGLTQLIGIPLLVIHAFQIVVFYLFGEGVIAVDMFLNVLTTSVSEAGEVLNGIMASVVFVIIVYVPTIVFAAKAFKRKTLLSNRFRLKSLVAGLGLITCSCLLCFAAKNTNTGTFTLHEDVYPADVCYNLKLAVHKWNKSNHYRETSKNFTFEARKVRKAPQREVYVLVIGETSRSENWSLYGYGRETTPLLEKDTSLVYFRDAITQSNTTHKSVSIMLTASSAGNYHAIYGQKSILEAFREVGFTTVFLSNQSANHTFTDFFAQEADYTRYFRFFGKKDNQPDEVLLPALKHCLDSIGGNLFVVLHTYGSHFNYKERYPARFARYTPDNVTEVSRDKREILLNAYDNTILYTDYFLSSLTHILAGSGACTTMLYSSDHGEDIMDDRRERFLHASPNPTYYQLAIPLLVWFSPVYQQDYPQIIENARNNRNKPVSTNAIFHTLLDMAGIRTGYLDTGRSLVSPDFKVAQRMYLNDHDNPIPFYNAGLKKEDKVMIEKRNINH